MKVLKRTAISLLLVSAVLILTVIGTLRNSLPLFDGKCTLAGLKHEVRVDRDSHGIPTVLGKTRVDIALALGFLHAQERFFQMDLMRRASAGELSEVFGKDALEFDKKRRLHQLRKNAKSILLNLSEEENDVLNAYTLGVNQGLQNLSARPFEYFILQVQPKEWLTEDSILVGLSLFFELQDPSGTFDLARGYLKEELPINAYHFFMSNGSAWESTLDTSKRPILDIPGKEDFQFSKEGHSIYSESPPLKLGGSNQWAVSGALTEDGAGLLACDMHLNFSVPNIWYRAAFQYIDKKGDPVNIIGVTLPGTPMMAIGSNGHIAWGFTNGFIDTTDLVVVKKNANNPNEYLTKNGPLPYETDLETIFVKGSPAETFEITKTIWGPILPNTYFGHPMAVQWIAHLPSCFNLRLMDLENAKNARESLNRLNEVKIAIMNFVVADKEGHIGWRWVGSLPNREGFDGDIPVSGDTVDALWKGLLDPSTYPEIYDPPQGYLWTANNRTIGNSPQVGQYLNGVRAHQIERRLKETTNAKPRDMLAIQLDDEAFFFRRWQTLLVDLLQKPGLDLHKKELLEVVKDWNGHCSVDSSAYYWIRTWRQKTYDAVLGRIFSKNCHLALHHFDLEEPLWQLVSEKPDFLVNPNYKTWDEELLAIVDTILKEENLKDQTWGSSNILQINHPFGKRLPFLDSWLNMPHNSVGGDFYVPFLNNPSVGSSQRMVVSPGNEEKGIFHMPCGQSGHPLSPHYRKGHSDWLTGFPSNLLPGPNDSTLMLIPQ